MPLLKAFRILSALNKEEFNGFEKFVQSPFFNKSKDVIKFFNLVKRYHLDFENPKLSFERIYEKLYPGKKYTEGTIRNLFSELGNLAEKFLAYVNYENTFDFGKRIISETNARYLDKDFNKNYKKYSEKNSREEDSNYSKNLNQFFLDCEMWTYTQRLNINFSKQERNTVYELLFAFFLNEFLIGQASQVNVTDWYKNKEEYNIVQIFFTNTNVKKIIENMEKNNSPHYEDLKLGYYLNAAAENKEGKFKENFEKAHELFNERIDGMSKTAQQRMYIWIINVINMHIKVVDTYLGKIKFTLEKGMVEKGVCFDAKGKMIADMFVHILHDAINAGEIAWAKEFLENKIHSISDDVKAKRDIYNFYKANLLSCEKKYMESNEELLKISNDDITFKIDAKTLRMINLYELGHIETAFSQAEALRQFLARNDEAYIGRKELSSNFLKFYLYLIRKKSGIAVDMVFAKKELIECPVLRNRVWLIEKFNEI